MSYCRWSSMNWQCDLYCYEDVGGGYTTHVAGNRVVGDIPKEPSWDLLPEHTEQFWAEHQAVMKFLETCKREPIGLAYDGETFNDDNLETFRNRLLMLRAAGYRFPDAVLEAIDEEMKGELVMDLNMADSLWAWMTEYPDGTYGMVAAIINDRAQLLSPLIGRDERVVRSMEKIARAHGAAHGQRVWLRRYDMTLDYPDD